MAVKLAYTEQRISIGVYKTWLEEYVGRKSATRYGLDGSEIEFR
jgi:hypothetical protein